MEQIITVELSISEVNAILTLLGDLPSKTGVYPILMKIKEQGEAQISGTSADSGVAAN